MWQSADPKEQLACSICKKLCQLQWPILPHNMAMCALPISVPCDFFGQMHIYMWWQPAARGHRAFTDLSAARV